MASSSTSTLSQCERLPDEVLLRVLGHATVGEDGLKRWCGSVRGASRLWRTVHDAACQRLYVRKGVTDEVMHALCGRLPALARLELEGEDAYLHQRAEALTADGLRAVGGLTALTYLNLAQRNNVTNAVLRELRGLTALTELFLFNCESVTGVGLGELRGLTELTTLSLAGNIKLTDAMLQPLTSLTSLTCLNICGCEASITKAGRDALKAALPALFILVIDDDFDIVDG